MSPLASHTVQKEQVCRTEQLVWGPDMQTILIWEGGKNGGCVYFELDIVRSHRLNDH